MHIIVQDLGTDLGTSAQHMYLSVAPASTKLMQYTNSTAHCLSDQLKSGDAHLLVLGTGMTELRGKEKK